MTFKAPASGARVLPAFARRVLFGALPCALLAAACGDEPSPAERRAAAPPRQLRPTETGTVTLVTGDRVTVRKHEDGPTAQHIQPGPGREHITFAIDERDGELRVVPIDVAALLAGGRLDPALFNITRLLAEGYGDAARPDLPLLLTGLGDAKAQASALAASASRATASGAAADVSVARVLPALQMLALRQRKDAPAAALTALAALGAPAAAAAAAGRAAPSPKLWLDRRVQLSLDQSVPQVGAPAAYARGLTGAGVKVAVLDTGIDAAHPDLAGKIAAAQSFLDGDPGTGDPDGHGTHVASIIAGSGAASDGSLHGVAPAATLLNGRVCDRFGCPFSAILAGLEWAAVEQGADIVNLSLGAFDTPDLDPLEEAVNRLSAERGTLFVIAAGNDGEPQSVNSPGSADAALCVGAVDRGDQLAGFSSQGPRTGDRAVKPDVTAPGVAIAAARSADGTRGAPGESYVRLSGTSMATPHVAGAAALLLQQHPTWSGAQLKAALMGSAAPHAALSIYQQGAGRLDLDRATAQAVTAEPASLSLGFAHYPHDDDPPFVRAVRYRNDGAAPITLTLSASLTHDGAAAPAAMISVAPATLIVPAGGAADATLTVDPKAGTANGLYSGALRATSGSGPGAVRVVTPIGVEREVESYDLTVAVLDSHGQPTDAGVSLIGFGPRGSPQRDIRISRQPVSGQATFRVPVGTYYLESVHDAEPIWLAAPRTAVTEARTVTLDGRRARKLELTLPAPGLVHHRGQWLLIDDEQSFFAGLTSRVPLATAEIGPAAAPGALHTVISTTFAEDVPRPVATYHLARFVPDHFPTGWKQTLRRKDLTTVHASHAGHAGQAGELLEKYIGVVHPADHRMFAFSFPAYEAPFERTEHFYGPGLLWNTDVGQVGPDPDLPGASFSIALEHRLESFLPGEVKREQWSQAPFGPGFPGRIFFGFLGDKLGVPRRFDEYLVLQPTLFSGQAPRTRMGTSLLDQGRIALFRDGELVEEWDEPDFGFFTAVPPEPARYRVEAEATRSAELFELSTQVSAAWEFSSRYTGLEPVALSLPTLRFFPVLDGHNRSNARAALLPIRIERPLGAPRPAIASAHVEVSFDDGASWAPLPLLRLGDQALGLILHPRDASHVSLRGGAADVEGSSVELSILRAYSLAPR